MTNKNGYQPIKTSRDNVTPPNIGSCVRAKITAGMDIQEDVLKLRIENEKLKEENLKLESKVRTLEIEQNYCLPNCSKITELEKQNKKLLEELEFYHAYNAEKCESCENKNKDSCPFLGKTAQSFDCTNYQNKDEAILESDTIQHLMSVCFELAHQVNLLSEEVSRFRDKNFNVLLKLQKLQKKNEKVKTRGKQ